MDQEGDVVARREDDITSVSGGVCLIIDTAFGRPIAGRSRTRNDVILRNSATRTPCRETLHKFCIHSLID